MELPEDLLTTVAPAVLQLLMIFLTVRGFVLIFLLAAAPVAAATVFVLAQRLKRWDNGNENASGDSLQAERGVAIEKLLQRMKGVDQALLLGRASVLSWLITSFALAEGDAEARLLAAVLMTSVSRVPVQEHGACIALWIARLAAVRAGNQLLSLAAWGPILLFALNFLAARASANAASVPLISVSPAPAARLERTGAKSLLLVDGPADFGFDRAVKCFPNWAPPSFKDIRAWTKAFSLKEDLLAAYACTVPAKFQHHGNLYISMGHVAFLGLAGLGTHRLQFVIAFEDVKEIKDGGSRDVARMMLKRPLLMKGRGDPVTSVELRGCEAGAAALAAILACLEGREMENSDGEDEGLPSRSQSGDIPATAASAPALGVKARARSAPTTASCPGLAALDISDGADGQDAGEPFHVLRDIRVPRLKTGLIGAELFKDEWQEGLLVPDHLLSQGVTEMKSAGFVDDDSTDSDEGEGAQGEAKPNRTVRIREVTYYIPVPKAPLCPSKTRVTCTYRFSVTHATPTVDASVLIESSSVSHDVPFGEKFVVQERIELSPAEDGTTTRLKQAARCIFLQSCGMLQGRIRSGALSSLEKAGDKFQALVSARAEAAFAKEQAENGEGMSGLTLEAEPVTCTVRIYELQRRTTLLHSDWRAPFLPHDQKKRWRWVDEEYNKHPWTSTHSREEAASMSLPPVEPRRGWAPLGPWELTYDQTDPEGWQYASEFSKDAWYWSKVKTGHHVRRRLWSRSFILKHPLEADSELTTESCPSPSSKNS